MERPSWDDYFMSIAWVVAARGDCTRRVVGAVIVDKERRIASTGYNGAPSGGPSCLAGECPRGKHYETGNELMFGEPLCACGELWPCFQAVTPGSSYDTGPGACVALHAEQNAILYADRNRLEGATIYITATPCDGCRKLIAGTKIERVVWPTGSTSKVPNA